MRGSNGALTTQDVRSAGGGSIGQGRSRTGYCICRRRVIDGDDLGSWAKDAITWGTCKVLNALNAAIVLALSDTIASELEASVETRLELYRAKVTENSDKLGSFHANDITDFELSSASSVLSGAGGSGG